MPPEPATPAIPSTIKLVENAPPVVVRRPGKAARVDNDALLGDLGKLRAGAAEKPIAPAAKPAKKEPPPAVDIEDVADFEPADVAASVPPAEEPEDDSDLDPPQPEPEKPAEEEGDDKPIGDDTEEQEAALSPAEAKRIAAAQRQERQFKERMAAERATFEREKKAHEREWAPRVEKAEQFERLAARARYAPDAVLEALGFGEDDWEPAARALYARSPAGQKDPAARAAAERMAREREGSDRLSRVERELAETKKALAERDQQAQTRATVDRYLGGVTKAIEAGTWRDPETRELHKVETPLVKAWLTKAPEKARTALHRVALDLLNEDDGRTPAPHEVAVELERRRREDLAELGVDLEAAAAPGKVAPKPKPGPTLGRSPAAARTPAPRLVNRDELFESLRADLAANKLDS